MSANLALQCKIEQISLMKADISYGHRAVCNHSSKLTQLSASKNDCVPHGLLFTFEIAATLMDLVSATTKRFTEVFGEPCAWRRSWALQKPKFESSRMPNLHTRICGRLWEGLHRASSGSSLTRCLAVSCCSKTHRRGETGRRRRFLRCSEVP